MLKPIPTSPAGAFLPTSLEKMDSGPHFLESFHSPRGHFAKALKNKNVLTGIIKSDQTQVIQFCQTYSGISSKGTFITNVRQKRGSPNLPEVFYYIIKLL